MGQLKAAEYIFDNSAPVDPLRYCTMITHPSVPVPEPSKPQSDMDYAVDADARITVVGIGPFGSRMVQLLSRNLQSVECHEVTVDPNAAQGGCFPSLLSSVNQNDLVFIISGFDDPSCETIAQAVGGASCHTGILTIAIAPPSQESSFRQGQEPWYDTMFAVSGRSLPAQPEPVIPEGDALTGYSMRHTVSAITNLITFQTGICIDFADVAAIMRDGSAGRVGVGVASGPSRGETAAQAALERLEAQGISIADAAGVLVSVHGSSTLTMDDFDDVSRVVHGCVAEDANIIVGLISDEQMGYNVKVTVMAVSDSL